jgi:enterochelin esterase-like enzyme
MSKPLMTALAASCLAPLIASAQGDDAGWKPSTANQPGREYPQVDAEGRVRARIVAPDATSVQLDIGAVKYPLKKGEDGAWVGESEPQDVGFHYYQVVIDGAQVPDPNSLYYYGASRWGSGVEIPAEDEEIYALRDVPHGRLSETYYHSKTSRSDRRIYIYTPPQYEADPSRRFPVLYLQHGMGENETGWGNQGHAARIMDNLIADGKAEPFIIVMENGLDAGNAELPAPRGGGGRRRFNFNIFERILIDDLIPFVDGHYRTLSDQPNRALAGLSMGGMQTRRIAPANLDKFSHIGVFSGGSIAPSEIEDMDEFKDKVKIVFFSFGGREGGGASARENAEAMKEAGVDAHYYESPGTAHEWQTWRRSLHRFAQLLFKD